MNYPHKVKIHIAATLFGLSVISMLLINIVILLFWYQHLVQQRVVRVKDMVHGLQSENPISDFNFGNLQNKSDLQMICRVLGPECRQVLMVKSDRVMTAVDTPDRWGLGPFVLSASKSGKEVIRQIDKADIPFFFTPKVILIVLPSTQQQTEHSCLGVVMGTDDILSELFDKQKIIALFIFINAIILSTIGFIRMRRVILQPIEKLVNVADNYQVSEGGGLFSDQTQSEFGQLSRSMNDMVRRIEQDRQKLCHTVDSLADANQGLKDAQKEILQSEKLASAGRLSAGFAHEIGNPVAIVHGYLELLKQPNLSEEEHNQFATRALDELQRMDTLLHQLLDVTNIKEAKNEQIDPSRILKDTFEVMEISFKKKNIKSKFSSIVSRPSVWGDGELLRQVVLNCLINAMDAVVEKQQGAVGGEITASLNLAVKENKKMVIIEVRDNGSGVSEDHLDFIFEPFFTTKGPGKGTGLGLAVSYRIIKSMSGRLEVESEEGSGAVFRIMLPVYNIDTN